MSSYNSPFIELVCQGRVLLDEIDDYIEYWHCSELEQSLSEYLGLTDEEYEYWLKNGSALAEIVHSRLFGTPIAISDDSFETRLAARSYNSQDIISALNKLKKLDD